MFTSSSKHLSALFNWHSSLRFRIDSILLQPTHRQLLPCASNPVTFQACQKRSHVTSHPVMHCYLMLPSRRVGAHQLNPSKFHNTATYFFAPTSHLSILDYQKGPNAPLHIRFKSTITPNSQTQDTNNDVKDPTTPPSTTTEEIPQQQQQQQLTTKQKAKLFIQKYGTVFIATYISIYITTLLSLFALLESNLLDPDLISQVFKVSKDFACETADVIGPPGSGSSMDEVASAYAKEISEECSREKRSLVEVVTGYLERYEWSRGYAVKMEQNPHLANLAVSWFMIKFTEPIRLAIAFMVVPKVAKALGRKVPKNV